MDDIFYPSSRQEAVRCGELDAWMESHRANIRCAGDIDNLIAAHTQNGTLEPDCAKAALDRWGFQRVQHVLNSTLRRCDSQSFDPDSFLWARTGYLPPDRENEDFRLQAHVPMLAEFTRQAHAEYQKLGMFGPEHCSRDQLDYTGQVLILRPSSLGKDFWSVQNQLWYAETGFGCSPTASGRAVYATCLGDGERARWNRSDFIGVLDEKFMPQWAEEKLSELHWSGQAQEQSDGPVQSGMEMR